MKDCCSQPTTDLSGVEDGLKSLFHAQLLLGKEVWRLLGHLGDSVASKADNLSWPAGPSSCCDIPEPCWMPLPLGEVSCQLAPGTSGEVCLVVTNGDFRPHVYQFVASGQDAAHVSFSQTSVTLGPKERVAITATFTVPREDKHEPDCRCIDHEALIWVRGCRNHYLRWVVNEVQSSKPCCKEVEVQDDPDYVLHWYDHFYITRPCVGAAARRDTPPITHNTTGLIR